MSKKKANKTGAPAAPAPAAPAPAPAAPAPENKPYADNEHFKIHGTWLEK